MVDLYTCHSCKHLPECAEAFGPVLRDDITTGCADWEPKAMKYEVNFRPVKRRVSGVHQPDIAYVLNAESRDAATEQGKRLCRAEHGAGYLYSKTVEVA